MKMLSFRLVCSLSSLGEVSYFISGSLRPNSAVLGGSLSLGPKISALSSKISSPKSRNFSLK